VIVLDLALPELNGFGVARIIREWDRSVAILAVTALTSDAFRAAAMAAGCDVYLVKPVEAATVVERALALCERRMALRQTQ
jgi:DNA-binding response OmpR family regulator